MDEKIQLSTYNGISTETIFQELITKAFTGAKSESIYYQQILTTKKKKKSKVKKKDLRKNEKDSRRKAGEARQNDSSEDVKTRILQGRRLWESQESTRTQQPACC